MDVCLMIEGQEGVTWSQWVGLAHACEAFGFEGLFRSDHYLSFNRPKERGALDAWTTIAALGVVTERIRLGTMVSPVTFRHPAVLAKSVVTADHASDGRVELGMGAGWFEREHEAFGFDFPPTRERMDMLDRAGRDRASTLGWRRRRGVLRRRALPARCLPRAPESGAGPSPTVDHRRWGGAAFGRAGRPVGRRVRRRLRGSRRGEGTHGSGLGRVRGDRT